MKNVKKLLSLLLALALVLSMSAMLAACGKEETSEQVPTQPAENANTTYKVNVVTAGGMAMEGLDVYVYADNTLSDLKGFGKTDAEGMATFDLPQAEGYAITVSGAPKGYQVKESYAFSGSIAKITLSSQLITDDSLSNEELERELNRSQAITSVAEAIIKNGELAFKAVKHADEWAKPVPRMLEASK
jgi:hypothetical protein